MASKRSVANGDGPETKYVKLSGREHILARPDMYTGSVVPEVSVNTVIGRDGVLASKSFSAVDAFLQCFEEILMNAADRVSAAHEKGSTVQHRTKALKVTVSRDEISVWNEGDGIEPVFLEEYQVFAPELIFGHLRSSSNYDDSRARINSGKNGFGAKICNVFSTTFRVETACAKSKMKYRQTFGDNLERIEKPSLTKFSGKPYTKITYSPDFFRLNMLPDKITEDIEGILRRRCYEVSATSISPVKVWFNGTKVPVTKIDHYASLYAPDAASRFSAEVNERWRLSIGVTPDHGAFRAISFCNSTATLEGGKHLDYVVDPLVKKLVVFYKKKFKTTSLKPSVIKDCLTVVVSAFIENPVYSSQCKNYLSSAPDKFGSTCVVPDSLFTKLATKSGLTAAVESFLKSKERKVLNATDGRKSSKIKGIAKLHDAARAGTRDSNRCVLFLCEGDSALTMLLSGLKSSDRDHCGCFPLKGKLLNIRDASAAQVAANTEISNIKKILGLQQGKIYDDPTSRKELRYGSVVLCVDADVDGKHIAGLLLNVFDCFWPSLVSAGFVKNMLTPIVRATGGPRNSQTKLFYNEFEFLEWMKSAANSKGYRLKYLKGLGSSTAKESKEYFQDFTSTLVTFTRDKEASGAMQLAFAKDKANDRKAWLSSYDKSEILLHSQKQVSLSDFVHRELKHFSESDVRRSIPSAIDGLKTSQRKILFGCFSKSTLNSNEMKVAQLCGYVADKSCYHHGEVSLSSAITNMAQDFVGSNNVNLLLPKGQLGSRLQGGKDAASPRYTFVQLNPLTNLIYRREDAPILEYTVDDGVQTEPVFYIPIIPMVLVNGASGIGSGFSTSVPAHDPLALIDNVRKRLASCSSGQLQPWYRGFRGSISPCGNADGATFKTVGVFEICGTDVSITELPIGTWTTSYKVFLDGLVDKKMVASYTEKCTDVDVDINVKLLGDHEEDVAALLKLSSTLRTSNMHLYSSSNRIKKFSSVKEIEEEHFHARFQAYVFRKEYVLKVLTHDLSLLESKLRFVESKLSGTIVIDNVSFDEAIRKLEEAGLPRLGARFDDDDKTYAYVTSLNMFDVTSERVVKLRKQVELKKFELDKVVTTNVPQMWSAELDELVEAMGNE